MLDVVDLYNNSQSILYMNIISEKLWSTIKRYNFYDSSHMFINSFNLNVLGVCISFRVHTKNDHICILK